jgi:hypothetical protein
MSRACLSGHDEAVVADELGDCFKVIHENLPIPWTGLTGAGIKNSRRKGEHGGREREDKKTEMHLLSQLLPFPLPSLIISLVYPVILLK